MFLLWWSNQEVNSAALNWVDGIPPTNYFSFVLLFFHPHYDLNIARPPPPIWDHEYGVKDSVGAEG